MNSINWVGRSALGVLSLSFAGGTALAQENTGAMDRVRLIGFDNGGWSEGATGQLASRNANGEPAARKGAAMEIARSGFHSGNARWNPQFKLRVERGRTAGRSDTSATISWKVRL
jgi:hypothetical protein